VHCLLERLLQLVVVLLKMLAAVDFALQLFADCMLFIILLQHCVYILSHLLQLQLVLLELLFKTSQVVIWLCVGVFRLQSLLFLLLLVGVGLLKQVLHLL